MKGWFQPRYTLATNSMITDAFFVWKKQGTKERKESSFLLLSNACQALCGFKVTQEILSFFKFWAVLKCYVIFYNKFVKIKSLRSWNLRVLYFSY